VQYEYRALSQGVGRLHTPLHEWARVRMIDGYAVWWGRRAPPGAVPHLVGSVHTPSEAQSRAREDITRICCVAWALVQVKEAHFCQPPEGTPGTENQGTLVVFNLDPSMPVPDVHALFSAFGEVKEVGQERAPVQRPASASWCD
jgi:hypothetical protein